MPNFSDALAGLDAAVRDVLLDDLEISPPIVAWRAVRGAVTLRPIADSFEGMSSNFVTAGDTVELDLTDFAGVDRPGKGWLVRFRDELGVLQVRALAEPLNPTELGGRFQSAPLKALDPADPRLA